MAPKLWKDVIEIPRAVQASDFVLKLSEGVTRAERTVDTYVVTKGVSQSFDKALGLIGAALDGRSSSGTYLHGSFGSGKSHFMAVLDLLLDQEHSHLVRKLDRLAGVIVKHEDWLGKKKLMMVPYHFLGAVSMEECILGGYVEFIRRTHPEAPLPVVFVSGKLLDNAESMREKLGDEAFLNLLSGDASGEDEVDGWGDDLESWDLDSYLAALNAKDPMAPSKQSLVADLITNVFPAAIDLAANARQGGYIGLDEGLQVISNHASSLGYDGVVLFLDELILWLSRHASDTEFIQREGQKLAKLVEAQRGDRPIPIISFVARQRSLSDFVGEAYTGQEKASFDFSLDWLSGRFSEIRLEDRDLPLIVKERLLRPHGAGEREKIQQSFENFKKQVQGHHRDFMRTRELDDELFEKVYPFSPALVQALVALSTFLQRERTALRLLLSLLVRHRETLQLGQVVPVGDLWDVVTEGQAPFSEALRRTYQQAVDLWNKKLRPMLVEDHGFDPELVDESRLKQQAWEDDARLLKTLLVAALVPQVEALRDMTISKLTALNYSAVTGFVPSMKDNTVSSKLRKWASQVGEIRITDEHSDARVSLQLSTLDVEILLDRVRTEDSKGNRRRKVRQLLYEWMDLDATENQYTKLQVSWRGAKRNARVYYRNVRELGDHAMTADGEEWNILIDYPFDDEGYSPREDQLQLERYQEEHPEGTFTLAWLPMFLSKPGLNRLGKLVKVEYVLDRFKSYSEDFSAEERPALRQQLDNLRSALRTQLKSALEIAYGLSSGDSDLVDKTHNLKRPLHSLLSEFNPRMPGGVDFSQALRKIYEAALAAQYPDSYRLPDEVLTAGKASKVLHVIEETLNAQDHRYFVEDKGLRPLVKGYAEAVGLGTMGETHFVMNQDWRDKIERALAGDDAHDKLTVGALRDIIEPEGAQRGTPRTVQDLVICTYALMEQMALKTPVGVEQQMAPGKLDDTIVLERRELPDETIWAHALEFAAEIFGIREEFPLLSAAAVEKLCAMIDAKVTPSRRAARDLPGNLDKIGGVAGLTTREMDDSPRYKGARALEQLFGALATDAHTDRLNAFVLHAQDEFQRALIVSQFRHLDEHNKLLTDKLLQKSLSRANQEESSLSSESRALLGQCRDVLKEAQHVQDLARLGQLTTRLFDLLVESQPKPTRAKPAAKPRQTARTYQVTSSRELDDRISELKKLLAEGKTLEIHVVDA